VNKLLFLSALLTLGACNGDSSNDGGTDATTELAADLCDINAFSGNGNACPHVSTRVCFPICEAGGGCTCSGSSSGPVWVCTNPAECHPCSNSPLSDAACDAGDDAPAEASDDASDAGSDAAADSD
jgi:hypothetical protein